MASDYFGKYFNENGFDFSALINDDFLNPVRIMFNARHYVSATKLLLIAIDSVSFVEYGDSEKNPFVKWLQTYSDIDRLNITAEELWQHRNALLHMSSLTSKKVKAGNVRMLVAYVGDIPSEVQLDHTTTGYYHLYEMIKVFGEALGKWLLTYDSDREKIYPFVERYDLIASDSRMLEIGY